MTVLGLAEHHTNGWWGCWISSPRAGKHKCVGSVYGGEDLGVEEGPGGTEEPGNAGGAVGGIRGPIRWVSLT